MGIVCVLLLIGCSGAPPSPAPSTSATSVFADGLQAALEGFIKDGVSSVVVQARWPDGEWSRAFGTRDPDGPEPAQPGDRFAISSVSKSMIAAAVLQLVDGAVSDSMTPSTGCWTVSSER